MRSLLATLLVSTVLLTTTGPAAAVLPRAGGTADDAVVSGTRNVESHTSPSTSSTTSTTASTTSVAPTTTSTTMSTSTTTTAAPTTTTTTTTTEPPAATTTTVPAPPPPPPSPDPGVGDPVARAKAAIDAYVPGSHRDRIPHRIQTISGQTSWAHTSGLIQIGAGQADDTWEHIAFVAVHEFGHLVAYHEGSGAYAGAPPAGFPATGNAAETWADCFATVVTGFPWTTHCSVAQLDWTSGWAASH